MMRALPDEAWIRRLPKVDLHLHLDGSVKPETIIQLASQHELPLPSERLEQLLPYMQVDGICEDLVDYLRTFDFVLPFLQTADALELVAKEVVEQAAEHHCKYIEVRFAPQLHRHKGLTVEQVIAHVLQGLRNGEEQYGVKARGIAICMRHHDDRTNLEVVRTAASFLDQGLVAVDLAGDEFHYPPGLFETVFREAGNLHIPITIHAGEAGGADNVYEAVAKLGALRIGHGIRLEENPDVLDLVKERRIPLEMCPISNIQTRAAASWASYPLRDYMQAGLLVTVNTDNLTVSGTNMTQEFMMLSSRLGVAKEEMKQLVLNGAEAAFLPAEEKQRLRREIEEDFERL